MVSPRSRSNAGSLTSTGYRSTTYRQITALRRSLHKAPMPLRCTRPASSVRMLRTLQRTPQNLGGEGGWGRRTDASARRRWVGPIPRRRWHTQADRPARGRGGRLLGDADLWHVTRAGARVGPVPRRRCGAAAGGRAASLAAVGDTGAGGWEHRAHRRQHAAAGRRDGELQAETSVVFLATASGRRPRRLNAY
jgi:hypothetical protein